MEQIKSWEQSINKLEHAIDLINDAVEDPKLYKNSMGIDDIQLKIDTFKKQIKEKIKGAEAPITQIRQILLFRSQLIHQLIVTQCFDVSN